MSTGRQTHIGRKLSNGQWLSVMPVTRSDFAEFLRSGTYFDARLWHEIYVARLQDKGGGNATRLLETHGPGADEVLRRIAFHWRDQRRYVRAVNWYEADAYCRSLGGRLPTPNEWKEVMDVQPPPPPAQLPSPCASLPPARPWKLFPRSLRQQTTLEAIVAATTPPAPQPVPRDVLELAQAQHSPDDEATWTWGGVLRVADLAEWCSGAIAGAGRPAMGGTEVALAPEHTNQMGFRVLFPAHAARSVLAERWAEL